MHIFKAKNFHLKIFIKRLANLSTPTAHNFISWERKNFWLRLARLNISKEGIAIGRGFQCIDGNEENIRIDRYAAIGHNVCLWNSISANFA